MQAPARRTRVPVARTTLSLVYPAPVARTTLSPLAHPTLLARRTQVLLARRTQMLLARLRLLAWRTQVPASRTQASLARPTPLARSKRSARRARWAHWARWTRPGPSVAPAAARRSCDLQQIRDLLVLEHRRRTARARDRGGP